MASAERGMSSATDSPGPAPYTVSRFANSVAA